MINERYEYERDGLAIYQRSFAIIRSEANLTRFDTLESHVAVRMIHACGVVELAEHIEFGHQFAQHARHALQQGAAILCDAEMVERGVTRKRLPADNPVLCTLRDERTAALAQQLGTTRSAAAMELWHEHMEGALVVIGNAPTALFHLLEAIERGAPRPAAVIGVPVGFVGAAESKQALAASALALPYAVVHGRMGGSAIASATVNALASDAV
ncbi:Precorrin-8X methylmutase [Carnimonas sp. R-84981]|uniref:precorrin-8X methylmutase n=1 Tax=Carnimonas bestiolae TaxID=3402172 RepID=UPI003EDB909B